MVFRTSAPEWNVRSRPRWWFSPGNCWKPVTESSVDNVISPKIRIWGYLLSMRIFIQVAGARQNLVKIMHKLYWVLISPCLLVLPGRYWLTKGFWAWVCKFKRITFWFQLQQKPFAFSVVIQCETLNSSAWSGWVPSSLPAQNAYQESPKWLHFSNILWWGNPAHCLPVKRFSKKCEDESTLLPMN